MEDLCPDGAAFLVPMLFNFAYSSRSLGAYFLGHCLDMVELCPSGGIDSPTQSILCYADPPS